MKTLSKVLLLCSVPIVIIFGVIVSVICLYLLTLLLVAVGIPVDERVYILFDLFKINEFLG